MIVLETCLGNCIHCTYQSDVPLLQNMRSKDAYKKPIENPLSSPRFISTHILSKQKLW